MSVYAEMERATSEQEYRMLESCARWEARRENDDAYYEYGYEDGDDESDTEG